MSHAGSLLVVVVVEWAARRGRQILGICPGTDGAGHLPGIPTRSSSEGNARGSFAAASGWCRPASAMPEFAGAPRRGTGTCVGM